MTGGHRPQEEEKKKGYERFAATRPAPSRVRSERGGRAESQAVVLTKRKHKGNDLRRKGNLLNLTKSNKARETRVSKMRIKPR